MIKTPLRGRKDPLKFASLPTCGFVAQLVERPTSIWEARVQAPSKPEIFSGFFFCNFFNCSLPARINSLLFTHCLILVNLFLNLEDVNILYLAKQTGEHTIFEYCKNKCHKGRLKEYIVEQCKSFYFSLFYFSFRLYWHSAAF